MTAQHRPLQPSRGSPPDHPDRLSRSGLASACRHTAADPMTAASVVVSRTSIRTVDRAPRTTPESSSSPHVTRPSSTNVAPNTHPRFHVHFTPTGSSWLNLVERWFAELTRRQIKRGTHRSTRALENAIRSYLTIYNEDPKPFVWHKTADEVLASVANYCQRISDSGH